MLRVEVSEEGRAALPAIDLADATFVIGSSPAARIRLPAAVARLEHVTIDRNTWRSADGSGALGDGHTFTIGTYRVRVAPAPAGAQPTPPQRTESLARELVRDLLGASGAPTLTVERGPNTGAKRALPPPEAAFVIGRGDDANWIIDDPDLSKRHVEIRRTWDGVRALDLESKNGTRLDGVALAQASLRDGMVLELGGLALRYRDPAERHIGQPEVAGPPATALAARSRAAPTSAGRARVVFGVAIVIALAALAGILALALR
ncbi:MAG: FHA domain-containing protein [Deltaproteobacteria bacterium]